jgi:NADH-quinone oxidoreductase subunit C
VPASPSDAAPLSLQDFAARAAEVAGGEVAVHSGTVKVTVPAERWVEALTAARDDLGLVFFSWLSAIDWANDVAVGDPPSVSVEERFEVLCTVADLSEGRRVTFSTSLSREAPRLASLVPVYAGADWHEREAHEMFGIEFAGHPNLSNLYLPDGFVGHPLRKSFPLLSREVKPWPGTVDVEAMPGGEGVSTENPEA